MGEKTYRIPVCFTSYGVLKIKAESLEEAKAKVYQSKMPLPVESYYLEDSIDIDEEAIELI